MWQAIDQRVDAVTRCTQTGFEQVAFMAELLDLLCQQGIGALQFFVAHKQAFHALGDLIDLGGVGHGVGILRSLKAYSLE